MPMLLLIHLAAVLGLASGDHHPHHIPGGGPNCKTEFTTVWETVHEERETQECVTKWVPECRVVSEKQCGQTTREVVSYDTLIIDSYRIFHF